jgi:prephenate dehydrogenase
VASKDTVIFSVPVQYMESILIESASFFKTRALVMDVSSVKMKPIKLMQTYLPVDVQIVGTHPLFGPQSGKNGIKGLNIVVCPVRTNRLKRIHELFADKLGLNVLYRLPEDHDLQMAYVQGLTHFIGRAVNLMDIPDVEQKTPAYQFMLEIKKNLGSDSWDLFLTIEKENPFAAEVRERFLKELSYLHNQLQNPDFL